MSAIRWADSRLRALSVWDTAVLKIYCIMFGAVVGAYAPGFLQQNILWFIAGVLLLGGFYGYRWFTAQPNPE